METVQISYQDSQSWQNLKRQITDTTDEESMCFIGMIFGGILGFPMFAITILGMLSPLSNNLLTQLGFSIALLCLAFLSWKWFRSRRKKLEALIQEERELLSRYGVKIEPDRHTGRRYTYNGVRCGVYCQNYLKT